MCGSTSPPTHYEPLPHLVWPTSAKNRYLNSRLVILHASELATELFDELQSPICMFTMQWRIQPKFLWRAMLIKRRNQ